MSEVDHYRFGNILLHTELNHETKCFTAAFIAPLDGLDYEEGADRHRELTAAMREAADKFDESREGFEDYFAEHPEQHPATTGDPLNFDDTEEDETRPRLTIDEQQRLLATTLSTIRDAWIERFDVPLALTASTNEVGATITSWDGENTETIDPRPLRMAGNSLIELADEIDNSDHPENND